MKLLLKQFVGLTLIALACLLSIGGGFRSIQRVGGGDGPLDAQSTTGPRPITPQVGAEGLNYVPTDFSISLSNIPAYIWRYGCGPTADGMILGYWDEYWDARGYDWIIPGSALTETVAVEQMIASSIGDSNHVMDYAMPIDNADTGLLPDKSEVSIGGAHTSNSLADFMHTSWSSYENYYGWSWFSDIPVAVEGYLNLVNPGGFTVSAKNVYLSDGTLTWETFTEEINAGRPMVFLVDSNRDGQTDHFIPVFGYDTKDGVNMYEAYNTWDGSPHWYVFEGMTTTRSYGIFGGTEFDIEQIEPTATPTVEAIATVPVATEMPGPTEIGVPTETPTPAAVIIPTPLPNTTPQPEIIVVNSGSLDKITDYLNWIAYSGGALLLVSWLLDRWKKFQAIQNKNLKWAINFGLSIALAAIVQLLLTYVPQAIWDWLDPWFKIVIGFFGFYTLQQLIHKVTKTSESVTFGPPPSQ